MARWLIRSSTSRPRTAGPLRGDLQRARRVQGGTTGGAQGATLDDQDAAGGRPISAVLPLPYVGQALWEAPMQRWKALLFALGFGLAIGLGTAWIAEAQMRTLRLDVAS